MSLPEEEDRAIAASLEFLADVAGINRKPFPKIPADCREASAKCWTKLNWMLKTADISWQERDSILRECRDFLYSFAYNHPRLKVPKEIRKKSYYVTRHFPLIAREYSNPYYGRRSDGT